jgi:hypothetical protein
MHKRGKLWGLSVLPLIGGLTVLGVGHRLLESDKPADTAAKLRIQIGELRSQIADARLLGEVASREQLPTLFIHQQAAQLARNLEESVDGLRRRHESSADRAAHAGSNGLVELRRIVASRTSKEAGAAGAQLEASLKTLQDLEHGLAPKP